MKKKNLVFVIIFPLIAIFLYAVLGHFLFTYQKNVNSNSEIEPAVNTYVVTFNAGEGSTVEPIQVVSGQTITAPTAPTRTSYQFSGWFIDAECTNEFNFANQIQSDITLYAKWTEIYTVSFETNGGSTVDAVTVLKGNTTTAPITTRSGYEFIGWYTNALYTQKYNFATAINSNVKLYARWAYILTAEDCTFELTSNGESYGITECHGNNDGLVIIPRTYNGKPVTFIGSHAFENCTLFSALIVPDNIVKVESYAFLDMGSSQIIYCEVTEPGDEWSISWNIYCEAVIKFKGEW